MTFHSDLLKDTLALAAKIALYIQESTGENILSKLDLQLESDLPIITQSAPAYMVVPSYTKEGFSTHADALGRVRLKWVDEFIASKMAIDPLRAARIPAWVYWPPSFQVSQFPTDDSKEFAWLNYNDRYWLHPYLNRLAVFAYKYERRKAPKGQPIPPSMLDWIRVASLIDTKACGWGTTDLNVLISDYEQFWTHSTSEDNDPRIPGYGS